MGQPVYSSQVDLLEVLAKKIQGVTNSVTKATMTKISREYESEAKKFFQELLSNLAKMVSRISPENDSIAWEGTAQTYGYEFNRKLTPDWVTKKARYRFKNGEVRTSRVRGFSKNSKYPPNLFRHKGELNRRIVSLGSQSSQLGTRLFNLFGGVTTAPKALKLNLPPGYVQSLTTGKLTNLQGKQVSYAKIVTQEIKDKLNYGPVKVLPGSNTFKTDGGRFSVSNEGRRGTISVYQAAFEGRLQAGLSFSLLSKLNKQALKAQSKGDPLAEGLQSLGALGDPKERNALKLLGNKKHGHHLLNPFFVEQLFGVGLGTPDSLNLRLSRVLNKHKGKKR